MASKAVPGLSARLEDPPAVPGRAPWPGHEYVRGWGVFGLPFDSGHVLGLRVFPDNDFAPYRSLWHRDPGGRWSIYVDGPRLDTACPRYFGAACHITGFARIGLSWPGPATLRVTMDSPALEWTLTATSTRILAVLNMMSAAMPLATWRLRPLVRARERLAATLGIGRLQLTGTMPGGHIATIMPERMYFVDDSQAMLDGTDLGRPAHLRTNPVIGGIPLPARGILSTGQAVFEILDPAEYQRTRSEAAAVASRAG
jgi:hypothetical protein